MNVLLDCFPAAIEVAGRVYAINADFRNCLRIILAFEDKELATLEKQMIAVDLLYDEAPENFYEAFRLAVKFLDCGEAQNGQAKQQDRLYSFEHDAKYIYSAIRQTHGLDLETVGFLHWWKFNYLFLDLHEDCFFNRIIYYRKKRREGALTKEEQEYCHAIADILDLPDELTETEEAHIEQFYASLK